jgi:hypothetical protein
MSLQNPNMEVWMKKIPSLKRRHMIVPGIAGAIAASVLLMLPQFSLTDRFLILALGVLYWYAWYRKNVVVALVAGIVIGAPCQAIIFQHNPPQWWIKPLLVAMFFVFFGTFAWFMRKEKFGNAECLEFFHKEKSTAPTGGQ